MSTRFRLLLLCCIFALAPRAFAQIENSGGNSGVSTATVATSSFTITSADYLLCGIAVGANVQLGVDLAPTSVIWNSTDTLTVVSGSEKDDGNDWSSVAWYAFASPSTGTGTVVLTWPTAIDQSSIHCVGIQNYTSTGTPSVANGTTANPSVTVVDSSSGEYVFAILSDDNSTGATTPGATELFDYEDVGSDTDHNSQYTTASGANTAMSWTQSSSGVGWAASGLAIAYSGGGGGTAVPVFLHHYQDMRH